MRYKSSILFIMAIGFGLMMLGCQSEATPRPDFSVISSPEVPVVAQSTPLPPTDTPLVAPPTEIAAAPAAKEEGPILFGMTPTAVLPQGTLVPANTPPPPPTNTPQPTPTTAKEAEVAVATIPPKPSAPPDAPRKGGSWDMEDGFEVWLNPFGDNCSGSQVAIGWKGFTSRGQYGSACLYLNDFGPNVFSGRYSQQVTFDFVDAHAGLYRAIDTQPGHTYQVTARIRHVHTLPPMQFHFGVDLSGGADWQAESVQWTPWSEFKEDEWITHTQTFTAAGPQTTLFIKGFHDTASQGGATYIDAVEVIDQG